LKCPINTTAACYCFCVLFDRLIISGITPVYARSQSIFTVSSVIEPTEGMNKIITVLVFFVARQLYIIGPRRTCVLYYWAITRVTDEQFDTIYLTLQLLVQIYYLPTDIVTNRK